MFQITILGDSKEKLSKSPFRMMVATYVKETAHSLGKHRNTLKHWVKKINMKYRNFHISIMYYLYYLIKRGGKNIHIGWGRKEERMRHKKIGGNMNWRYSYYDLLKLWKSMLHYLFNSFSSTYEYPNNIILQSMRDRYKMPGRRMRPMLPSEIYI